MTQDEMRREYAALQASIGTQEEVARAADVDRTTISQRRRGRNRVTREALYALRYLSEHPELLEKDDE